MIEISEFEKHQFFSSRVSTSIVLTSAGKHFLTTNKVLESISGIRATSGAKNYGHATRRSGENCFFLKMAAQDPHIDG